MWKKGIRIERRVVASRSVIGLLKTNDSQAWKLLITDDLANRTCINIHTTSEFTHMYALLGYSEK
jgi:hypothetical protein